MPLLGLDKVGDVPLAVNAAPEVARPGPEAGASAHEAQPDVMAVDACWADIEGCGVHSSVV